VSKAPPPWLMPQYAAQRARTLDLVQRSIAALKAAGDPVTVWRIVETSRQLDPTHRGISEKGVMQNSDARACYVAARTSPRRATHASREHSRTTPPTTPVDDWAALRDLLPDDVFHAPRTWGDPSNRGRWPAPHPKVTRHLAHAVLMQPWSAHLALAAAVISAKRLDPNTIRSYVVAVNAKMRGLFDALGIEAMDQWRPAEVIPAYLREELLPRDTTRTRANFWSNYSTFQKHMRHWMAALTEEERERYRPYVLPVVEPWVVEGLTKVYSSYEESKAERKQATDAVVPYFADMRAEAHRRFNRISRLRQAYRQALAEAQRRGPNAFPLAFSLDEPGSDGATVEQLHFRLWDRRSFILAHKEHWSPLTIDEAARRRGRYAQLEWPTHLLVEYVRADRLIDGAPADGLWFDDLYRLNLVGEGPVLGSIEQVTEKQRYLRSFGYGRRPFNPVGGARGILTHRSDLGTNQFHRFARPVAEGTLIPIEEAFAAAAFGLLALDLFTTTGMRMNELLQIRITRGAFVRTETPAPPGATDRSPRVRWLFRLIPKGERADRPADYYIGEETRRLIAKIVYWLVRDHYELASGEGLPIVPYDPHHGRSHRFSPGAYLFQHDGRALSDDTLGVCLRFLLHRMVFYTRDGKPVAITPHLLRHVFATYAVQVEKVPLDVKGEMLKQKNLDVTDYYSQPTGSMVASAADMLLARFASHLDVGDAITRTPSEVRQLYEEARGKVGALAEVIGGHCVQAGFCPAKFACIGCPANAVDPARREQIEGRVVWLNE
jgi:integrase